MKKLAEFDYLNQIFHWNPFGIDNSLYHSVTFEILFLMIIKTFLMTRKIHLSLLLSMILTWSVAQEDLKLLTSAGNYYENADVSLSWSLGEILIETVESDRNIVTQGFHQSFQTTVHTPNGEIKVKIYPNPTSGQITFEGDVFINEDVKFIIYDVLGKKLVDEMIPKGNVKFTKSILDFAAASYYLTFIINGDTYHKTFKIHKID